MKIFAKILLFFFLFFGANSFAIEQDNGSLKNYNNWNDFMRNEFLEEDLNKNKFPDGSLTLPTPDNFNQVQSESGETLRAFILQVLNFILGFLGLIGVAGMIYAGILYMSSPLDEAQVEKAKKLLIWIPIGIIIVLISYAAVNTIIAGIATGCSDRGDCPDQTGDAPRVSTRDDIIGKSSIRDLLDGRETGIVITAPTGLNIYKYQGDYMISRPTSCAVKTMEDSCIQSGCEWNGDKCNTPSSINLNFKLKFNAEGLFDFGDGSPQATFDNSIYEEEYDSQDFLDALNPFKEAPKNEEKFRTEDIAGIGHSFANTDSTYEIQSVAIGNDDGKDYRFKTRIFIGGLEVKIRAPESSKINQRINLTGGARSKLGNIRSYLWSCSYNTDNNCPGFDNTTNDKVLKSFTPEVAGDYIFTLQAVNQFGVMSSASAPTKVKQSDVEFGIYGEEGESYDDFSGMRSSSNGGGVNVQTK